MNDSTRAQGRSLDELGSERKATIAMIFPTELETSSSVRKSRLSHDRVENSIIKQCKNSMLLGS